MSDLISRQDAREAIEKLMEIHFDRQVVLAKARDAIVSLPSAEAVQGWIPCSEMLPSRSGMFLATVSEMFGFPSTVWRVMFDIKQSKWFVYGEEFDTDITDDVLAWMPLPTPYKGGDDE